jgi:hypothetical protein
MDRTIISQGILGIFLGRLELVIPQESPDICFHCLFWNVGFRVVANQLSESSLMENSAKKYWGCYFMTCGNFPHFNLGCRKNSHFMNQVPIPVKKNHFKFSL